MSASSYWKICVEESLSDHGVSATPEQIAAIVEDIEGAAENESTASGYDVMFKPSLNPLPKRGLLAPRNTGTRAYMDGSAPDETWIVEDGDTGKCFRFHGQRAGRDAKDFFENNR